MKRLLLATAAVLAVLALVLGLLYQFSWRFRNAMNIVGRIGPHVSVAYPDPGQPVRIESGGLSIAGNLLRPAGGARHAAVLLLHGSSPWGRNLGLYRILAVRLAERDYVVLRIDLRGYGDSDDPARLDDLADLDSTADVKGAITYLSGLRDVDPERIYLIGHSYGAGVAIGATAADPRVAKLVAIGPPRRELERLATEGESFRKRYSRDRRMKAEVPPDVYRELVRATNIDAFIPFFASDHHPPIFLIDGEYENPEDLTYLADYYGKLSPPKRYMTLRKTAHYLSTANVEGTRLVFYDKRILNPAVDLIDAWLRTRN